jgi:hypothetical protein
MDHTENTVSNSSSTVAWTCCCGNQCVLQSLPSNGSIHYNISKIGTITFFNMKPNVFFNTKLFLERHTQSVDILILYKSVDLSLHSAKFPPINHVLDFSMYLHTHKKSN